MSNTTPTIPFYPMTHGDAEEMSETLRGIRNVMETGRAYTIYAFHINPSESDPADAVTYLKDAVGMIPARMNYAGNRFDWGSWGNAFFLPKPCMLKYDGTVDYYLDPDDYSKKADGTASDVADTSYAGNAMMEWGRDGKKIWYKIVPDENNAGATVYIADGQVDPDYAAWSFINSAGQLASHFYTPCYFGTIVNDVLRSLSGQSGSNRCKNKTAAQERTLARANNPSGVDVWDMECWADVVLINLLLILIGKSLDTQAVFGEGLHTGGTDAINNGYTSGQHDAKGLFWGTNSGTASSSTYGNAVKVFGMENWYGFMWRRFNGLAMVDGAVKYKMTRGKQDGSAASDYTTGTSGTDYTGYLAGGSVPTASGTYASEMRFTKDHFLPKTMSGTAATYWCDGFWSNLSGVRFAFRGGASSVSSLVGAFYLNLNNTPSNTNWNIGAAPSSAIRNGT